MLNNKTFLKGELFCGPGGLAWGAKVAKVTDLEGNDYSVKHLWANDIDPFACETFRKNILTKDDDKKTVINQDVKTLNIDSLPKIDAFSFGFPCNDFSIIGESKGITGEYGALYTYGVKVLKRHLPDWFIAENVGGLESANGGKAFVNILEDLESVGYTLTPHLYKFEEYGIPQARHRIIIVGIRKDLGLTFRVPKPTTPNKNDWKTVKEALRNIPVGAFNNELTRHKPKVVEMLKKIKPGDNAWSKDIPVELRLNVKGAKLSNIYKRLHPNLPAYTVTGSGGGGTHMYHFEEYRALTNRERARLQTFSDDFIFIGNKESVRKQIGMAVPPEGARIIIEAILKTFASVKYPFIEARWKNLIDVKGKVIKKYELQNNKTVLQKIEEVNRNYTNLTQEN
jgi:DNA (cytosine-5)-methyltransferase 1